MLKPYDYLDEILAGQAFSQRIQDLKLNRFASEIMELLEISDEQEIQSSLERAFQTIDSLNISFDSNFRKVFRYNGDSLVADWRVSPLAFYLIVINCSPGHKMVARAQLYFTMKQNSIYDAR